MYDTDLSYKTLNVTDSLDELSDSIKHIHLLVTDVDKLKRRVGTVTDNEQLWLDLSQIHQTFQTRVAKCKRLLSRISYVRGLSKYDSIQTSRLKQDLKDVVQLYTKLQKQISSTERGLIRRSRNNSLRDGEIPPEDTESLVAMEQHWLDGQEILEREQQIRQIEDDMVSVADMMKQISYMVHDQGTELDNIEAHIAESHQKATEGTAFLHKAERATITRRKRIMCLSVTFLIILTILIVTIVLVHKTG